MDSNLEQSGRLEDALTGMRELRIRERSSTALFGARASVVKVSFDQARCHAAPSRMRCLYFTKLTPR